MMTRPIAARLDIQFSLSPCERWASEWLCQRRGECDDAGLMFLGLGFAILSLGFIGGQLSAP